MLKVAFGFVMACLAATLAAQTQVNLGGVGVKGVLPARNGGTGVANGAFIGNRTGVGSDSTTTYSADTGQGDRHAFDMYSAAEWDASTGASFHLGIFAPTAAGTIGKVTRAFSYQTAGYKGYVIQSQLFYSGSNTSNLMCVSFVSPGVQAASSQEDCLGFTAAGFVNTQGTTSTTLVPAASLVSGNWWTVTLWDLGGGAFTASMLPVIPNDTFGGITWLGSVESIAAPTNLQLEGTAATDEQRETRYAIGGPAPETLMVPTASDHANAPTLISLFDAAGTKTYALIPASYRTGVQSPWVIYDHGFDGSGMGITNEGGLQNLTNALVQAGYVVVASDYSNSMCMGDNACVVDEGQLQKQWQKYLNLAPQPYVIAESMGGIVAWNSIVHGLLHPRAVVGIYPVCNLAAVYADTTNAELEAAITSSFAITGSNPYATATSGYDPMLAPVVDFTAFPILMWSSYSDVTVYRTTNEDPFAARINAAGGNAVINTSTGTHGDISNFDPKAVVAFFNAN